MAKRSQHVLPHNAGWAVRGSGTSRVSEVFGTQQEALNRASEIARRDGVELFIHGRDGRIAERSSFEKAPNPPKG